MRCKACDSYIPSGELCDFCCNEIFIAEETPFIEDFIAVKKYIKFMEDIDEWNCS